MTDSSLSSKEIQIPEGWDDFCGAAGENARANQIRIDSFFQFRETFQKNGVDVLPLKGLDLLLRAYPSASLRPMADCDLLIRKKDIAAVMRTFEKQGFRRKPDEGLTYLSEDKRLNFDILWDIWYLNGQDIEKIWSRSAAYIYEGRPLKLMGPEDALIYLVTYVTAHRGVLSPLLVQDLQFFFQSETCFDWDLCLKKVHCLKMKTPFYRGLLYAAQNGCAQIPDDVLTALFPSTSHERRLSRIYEKIVTEEGHPPVSYFFTWLGYPGLAGKFKLLREKLFPSKWEADIHWGRTSYLVYVTKIFLRPFYLLLRGVFILTRDLFFFLPRYRR